jgi:hypothetical protein
MISTEILAVRARTASQSPGNFSFATMPVSQPPAKLVEGLRLPKDNVNYLYNNIWTYSDDISAFLCSELMDFDSASLRQIFPDFFSDFLILKFIRSSLISSRSLEIRQRHLITCYKICHSFLPCNPSQFHHCTSPNFVFDFF